MRKHLKIFFYLAAVGIVALLGRMMKLEWVYQGVAFLMAVLPVSSIYKNYKRRQYERKRFDYANAYITHMGQEFAEHGKILQALKETRNIFTEGDMKKKLIQAISHIEDSFDVELAEHEALEDIATEYDCERIRTLHDFLLRAEQRGGSCGKEFRLLESIRQVWEQSVLKHCKTMGMTRNLVVFEYVLLVVVCIFMLYQFPTELEIIQLPLVQVLNTFLIVCFFILYYRMDKKQSGSLLKDVPMMTRQQAMKKLRYIRSFQEKMTIFQMLECGKYIYIKWQLKQEIKRVFPCWLFDVLLLLQSENVSVALGKSIDKAPPVLRGELEKMQQDLEENPMSAEVFLSFFQEFHMPEIEGIMHKLYALNQGTGIGQEVMNLIIDTNMKLLAESEQQRLHLKGDLMSVYYMLPTVPIMIGMIGYGVALMFVIFQNVVELI